MQEVREVTKSGGWQEKILKINISILIYIHLCDNKTVAVPQLRITGNCSCTACKACFEKLAISGERRALLICELDN